MHIAQSAAGKDGTFTLKDDHVVLIVQRKATIYLSLIRKQIHSSGVFYKLHAKGFCLLAQNPHAFGTGQGLKVCDSGIGITQGFHTVVPSGFFANGTPSFSIR